MEQQMSNIEVFCCYAHEDEDHLKKLKKHLSSLRRQQLITVWHDRDISAGTVWNQEIKNHLNDAHIILLLISPDFIDSDYCYNTEMKHAMERHERKEAIVIPVIARPVSWQKTPAGNSTLDHLQALPKDAKPVTTWKNRDEAWNDVAEGVGNVARALLKKSSTSQPILSSLTQEESDKRSLLYQVEMACIQHLNHALKGQVEVTLMLQQRPHFVANPWFTVVQERATFDTDSLLTDGQLLQAYDQAMGQLLILGEAGSGKTILLLKLLRKLLTRAYQDEHCPLPILFALSSWSLQKLALEDWLVQQLHEMYKMDAEIAKRWVATHSILPLLDSLDEVEESARAACIDAITLYQEAHRLKPLVVCCRSADYERILTRRQQKLRLRQAVCIQPLTLQQIDDALTNGGTDQDGVLTTIHNDPGLQELATSPFILGLLREIARDTRLSSALTSSSIVDRQQQIFNLYIQSVLHRRKEARQFTSAQTLSWLARLARQLDISHQTVFYLDRMQFDWLPEEQSRRLSMTCTLLFKLIIGTSTAGAGIQTFGLIGGLIFGLMGMYLAKSDLVKGEIEPAEKVIWSWTSVKQQLATSLFAGLRIGVAIVIGIILLSIVSILLFFVFPTLTVFGLDFSFSSLVIDEVVVILGSVLLLIVQSGWTSVHLEERLLKRPNQGIWRSGRHSLIVGLIFGGMSCLMFSSLLSNIIDGLLCGWTIGIAVGLLNGGMACIKHLLLRWCLWRNGSIPWHYSHFLDYADERMLLHKVGVGYQFFHQLLLKHFLTSDLSTLLHQETEQV